MAEPAITERNRLQYFLDQQRGAVLSIIEGLDEQQLGTPVLPSGWTPLGLVRHLAGAEILWFQSVVAGIAPAGSEWDDDAVDPPYDPQAPFRTEHSAEAVIAHYRRQCARSNEILASIDLDGPLAGEHRA